MIFSPSFLFAKLINNVRGLFSFSQCALMPSLSEYHEPSQLVDDISSI